MQVINTGLFSKYSIFAPRALTGRDLNLEKNIFIEIKHGFIVKIKLLSPAELPPVAQGQAPYTCLEEGLTLLPCLIDAHVHLALDGSDFIRTRAVWDRPGLLRLKIDDALRKTLSAGTGMVRDGGDIRCINLSARNRLNSCPGVREPLPRVISTGFAIRRRSGYGSFLGPGYSDRREIPALVNNLSTLKVDQLKVVASGVVDFKSFGRVGGARLTHEELVSITALARKKGLRTMVHASSADAVDLAVWAGADSIEHGYFVRSDTLKLMAEKGVAWVPTVVPVAVHLGDSLVGNLDEAERNTVKRICEHQLKKVAEALRAGVRLGVGTDSGAPGVNHGHGLLEEMMLYREAGLNNREILKAAVANNALILGCENEAGAIENGFRAQLIAVRGNPLGDLDSLKRVACHFTAG